MRVIMVAVLVLAISLLVLMSPSSSFADTEGGGRRLGYPTRVSTTPGKKFYDSDLKCDGCYYMTFVGKCIDAGSGYEAKVGSNILYCEHQCHGCTPCVPVVVVPGPPSSNVAAGSGNNEEGYTQYEPVVWKCECRPTDDGGMA
ncbi:unnamed protein product [Linum tenue]|uniref:Epidermal patterning factor-like protein n=1 Tax=Linum tenue TaxID=586396 RepID=A0AAV0HWJ2_9ROSI|nr:unnamed protein product [Linum tenue]